MRNGFFLFDGMLGFESYANTGLKPFRIAFFIHCAILRLNLS